MVLKETEIPFETRRVIQNIVKNACMKVLKYMGGMYHLGVEFAIRYYIALRSGDKYFAKDVKETYKAFGVPENLMKEIVKQLETRYGQE